MSGDNAVITAGRTETVTNPKTLLVTGGSRGIGAAVVRLAVARDWQVAFTYLDQTDAAHDLEAALSGKAIGLQKDARDIAAIPALFDHIEQKFGAVSGLVNNAGIHGGVGPLSALTPDRFDSVMNTNLKAALFHIREFAARCRRDAISGSVVNLSSTVATFGGNGLIGYAAAKAGLETATIGLARELGPDQIRVNAVAPGVIDTDQLAAMPKDRRLAQLKTIALGRFGTPEDVARAILFLLSDEASYITGSTLSVHGGR